MEGTIKWIVMVVVALVVCWLAVKRVIPMAKKLINRSLGRAQPSSGGEDEAAKCLGCDQETMAPILVIVVARHHKRREILHAIQTTADLFRQASHPYKVVAGVVLTGMRSTHEVGFRCGWLNQCVKKHMGSRLSAFHKNRLVDRNVRTMIVPSPWSLGACDTGTLINKAVQCLHRQEPWIMITLPGVRFNHHWDVIARSEIHTIRQSLEARHQADFVITEPAYSGGEKPPQERDNQLLRKRRQSGLGLQEVLRRRSAELPAYCCVESWDPQRAVPLCRVERCQMLPARPLSTGFLSMSCLLGPSSLFKRLVWPQQLPTVGAVEFYASLYLWYRGVRFFTPTRCIVNPHCPDFVHEVSPVFGSAADRKASADVRRSKEIRALNTLWNLMHYGRPDLSETLTTALWQRTFGLEWDPSADGRPPTHLRIKDAARCGIPCLRSAECREEEHEAMKHHLDDHPDFRASQRPLYDHFQVMAKYGGWNGIEQTISNP